jgi:hypothetical protein
MPPYPFVIMTFAVLLGRVPAMKSAAVLLASLLLATLPAAAQTAPTAPPFPPRFKIIYSNLCSGPEPYAMHGHRVEFEYTVNDGGFVTIEFFDTGFDSDVLHATGVKFDRQNGALSFIYLDWSDEYDFSGSITSKQLTGYFQDAGQTITLPRVPNSWPEAPPCQANGLPLAPE